MSLSHPLATAGYVPYTPRQQRPQQRHALLRTAAQSIALDSASLGWALLDRLVSEPGWTDIWQALALGRATLLLPTAAHSDRTPITQELVKDHVAFVDAPASQLVTLSGLRALLYPDLLVFRSSLHQSSAFHAAHRAHAFSHIPPLPLADPQTVASRSYPTYALLSPLHTQLSVPATAPNPLKPPPLPPRPISASTAGTSTPHRLPNPFASLFRNTTPPPPPPPPPAASASTSIETGDAPISTLTISVLLIDKPVLRSDVAKHVNAAIRAEISRRFDADPDTKINSSLLAPWVATFLHEFALKTGLYPFTARSRTRARTSGGLKTGGRDRDPAMYLTRRLEVAIAGTVRSSSRQGHQRAREEEGKEGKEDGVDEEDEEDEEYDIAAWPNASAENETGADLADLLKAFQDFYAELEREARSKIGREREQEGEQVIDGADSTTDAADAAESLIVRIVESAESILCSLFYDRLFMHPSSHDTSHDSTLSSRIAALNIVDITLDRLDMDISAARDAGREGEVDEVIRECGKTLMRLETCRSPKDKAAVLVEAHKVVVDGLARLPPIKLIPEEARGRGGSDGEEMKEIRRRVSTTVVEPTAADGGAESETVEPNSEHQGNSSPKPTPVSGDILLPFLIFSVVKSNPPHLVSHLLFTQRFRNTHLSPSIAGGEESYCMINLMAVAEFLENVDLSALGVDAVISPSHPPPDAEGLLSPILKSPGMQKPSSTEGEGGLGLRDRVEQQVDAIGAIGVSANKVLAGVMDTSFGILKSLITPGQQEGQAPRGHVQNRNQVHAPVQSSLPAPVHTPIPTHQQPSAVVKPEAGQ